MKHTSLTRLCELSGVTRQAYYKKRHRRKHEAIDEGLIVTSVQEMRYQQPRMGTRKLHHELEAFFTERGISIGRDRLFDLLGRRKLLIQPKKRWVATTNSRHNLPMYRNLIKEKEPTAPHQILVSDITYIRAGESWLYLSLIMDRYSRKIVGWNLGDSLDAKESLKALHMAIDQVPKGQWPIHHSDRGSQYCCHAYTKALTDKGWSVSMTEENHCAENCFAERVNGIIKGEYNLDLGFKNREQARKATIHAINMYNNFRPHNSLNKQKPSHVHQQAA